VNTEGEQLMVKNVQQAPEGGPITNQIGSISKRSIKCKGPTSKQKKGRCEE